MALHVADDPHAQHTRVLVQGRADIVEGPVAPAASRGLQALTERLARWRTWTGQEWHGRYR